MAKKDYYEVLGVAKSASEQEIKRAYRKLVKQYHPDNKETGSDAKFKEIQEAYEILMDQNKRAAYDQYGHAGVDPNGFAGQGGFGGGFNGGFGFEDIDLGDIFGSFFGGGGQSRRTSRGPRRGEDRFLRQQISFEDSVTGKTLDIKLRVDEECHHCHGSGADSPSDIQTCPTCQGHGAVRQPQQTPFGIIESTVTCPDCHGTGKKITKVCHVCQGKGYETKDVIVNLKIPAGIDSGQSLRVSNHGYRGANGGPNGDLYIEIVVTPHRYFKRQDKDVYLDVPISFVDAALGVSIDVPTIYGESILKIPEGTQPDQLLRLRGKGFKDVHGRTNGDQYVRVKVTTPTKLSKEEKDLYRQLKDKESQTKESSFDKFRKAFKK